MGIIHILDARVANQIAAGEVIERPLSAVKELVENALDAHATNITVEIDGGGVDLIKVTDDGDGFYKDDLPLAIERHATSKISDFNDVYRLDTFGFRGEALASIAVISRLRITSGQSETEPAHVFTSDADGNTALSVAAPRKGTCIEVRDLYYNVPARKKFVRSNSHESALIYDLICKFALGFPAVNFTYLSGGEVVFSSNQLDSVEDLLHYIYGESESGKIIHIKDDGFYQKQRVEAWFFPPSVTRKNRNHMTYFVNGRLIESRELDQIIDEAVYTLVPKGRFLICVLKLELPAFNVDVNIHPSKKVIKFKNLEEWRSTLVTLLKEELWLSRLAVPFPVNAPEEPFALKQQKVEAPVKPQTLDFSAPQKPQSPPQILRREIPRVIEAPESVVSEPSAPYEASPLREKVAAPAHEERAAEEAPAAAAVENDVAPQDSALTQSTLAELEYIGQLNQTFILAQDRDNLYIIDQHTLHERILYERFMKNAVAKDVARQPLLHPVGVKVSPLQEAALVQNIFTLDALGFTVESKGPLYYELKSVPALLSQESDLALLFCDMLDDLQNTKTHRGLAEIDEEHIIMAACKGAVKAHYKLGEPEVRYLLGELAKLDNPHTCPHGRPIIMNISMNELYLFFKRGSFA